MGRRMGTLYGNGCVGDNEDAGGLRSAPQRCLYLCPGPKPHGVLERSEGFGLDQATAGGRAGASGQEGEELDRPIFPCVKSQPWGACIRSFIRSSAGMRAQQLITLYYQ